MRKLFLLGLILFPLSLKALPFGNPSDPSMFRSGALWQGWGPHLAFTQFSFRSGFYGDYVFNRHLKTKFSEIEKVELFTNAYFCAFNFWDRLDILGTVGNTHLNIKSNASSFASLGSAVTPGEMLEMTSKGKTSWSVGVKAIVWQNSCHSLTIEGQYFRVNPQFKRITIASAHENYPTDIATMYEEWQVGLGIARTLHFLTPYVAMKWSGVNFKQNNARIAIGSPLAFVLTLHDQENKSDWGYVVGVSLLTCDQIAFNLEGRFYDEKGLSLTCQIRL